MDTSICINRDLGVDKDEKLSTKSATKYADSYEVSNKSTDGACIFEDIHIGEMGTPEFELMDTPECGSLEISGFRETSQDIFLEICDCRPMAASECGFQETSEFGQIGHCEDVEVDTSESTTEEEDDQSVEVDTSTWGTKCREDVTSSWGDMSVCERSREVEHCEVVSEKWEDFSIGEVVEIADDSKRDDLSIYKDLAIDCTSDDMDEDKGKYDNNKIIEGNSSRVDDQGTDPVHTTGTDQTKYCFMNTEKKGKEWDGQSQGSDRSRDCTRSMSENIRSLGDVRISIDMSSSQERKTEEGLEIPDSNNVLNWHFMEQTASYDKVRNEKYTQIDNDETISVDKSSVTDDETTGDYLTVAEFLDDEISETKDIVVGETIGDDTTIIDCDSIVDDIGKGKLLVDGNRIFHSEASWNDECEVVGVDYKKTYSAAYHSCEYDLNGRENGDGGDIARDKILQTPGATNNNEEVSSVSETSVVGNDGIERVQLAFEHFMKVDQQRKAALEHFERAILLQTKHFHSKYICDGRDEIKIKDSEQLGEPELKRDEGETQTQKEKVHKEEQQPQNEKLQHVKDNKGDKQEQQIEIDYRNAKYKNTLEIHDIRQQHDQLNHINNKSIRQTFEIVEENKIMNVIGDHEKNTAGQILTIFERKNNIDQSVCGQAPVNYLPDDAENKTKQYCEQLRDQLYIQIDQREQPKENEQSEHGIYHKQNNDLYRGKEEASKENKRTYKSEKEKEYTHEESELSEKPKQIEISEQEKEYECNNKSHAIHKDNEQIDQKEQPKYNEQSEHDIYHKQNNDLYRDKREASKENKRTGKSEKEKEYTHGESELSEKPKQIEITEQEKEYECNKKAHVIKKNIDPKTYIQSEQEKYPKHNKELEHGQESDDTTPKATQDKESNQNTEPEQYQTHTNNNVTEQENEQRQCKELDAEKKQKQNIEFEQVKASNRKDKSGLEKDTESKDNKEQEREKELTENKVLDEEKIIGQREHKVQLQWVEQKLNESTEQDTYVHIEQKKILEEENQPTQNMEVEQHKQTKQNETVETGTYHGIEESEQEKEYEHIDEQEEYHKQNKESNNQRGHKQKKDPVQEKKYTKDIKSPQEKRSRQNKTSDQGKESNHCEGIDKEKDIEQNKEAWQDLQFEQKNKTGEENETKSSEESKQNKSFERDNEACQHQQEQVDVNVVAVTDDKISVKLKDTYAIPTEEISTKLIILSKCDIITGEILTYRDLDVANQTTIAAHNIMERKERIFTNNTINQTLENGQTPTDNISKSTNTHTIPNQKVNDDSKFNNLVQIEIISTNTIPIQTITIPAMNHLVQTKDTLSLGDLRGTGKSWIVDNLQQNKDNLAMDNGIEVTNCPTMTNDKTITIVPVIVGTTNPILTEHQQSYIVLGMEHTSINNDILLNQKVTSESFTSHHTKSNDISTFYNVKHSEENIKTATENSSSKPYYTMETNMKNKIKTYKDVSITKVEKDEKQAKQTIQTTTNADAPKNMTTRPYTRNDKLDTNKTLDGKEIRREKQTTTNGEKPALVSTEISKMSNMATTKKDTKSDIPIIFKEASTSKNILPAKEADRYHKDVSTLPSHPEDGQDPITETNSQPKLGPPVHVSVAVNPGVETGSSVTAKNKHIRYSPVFYKQETTTITSLKVKDNGTLSSLQIKPPIKNRIQVPSRPNTESCPLPSKRNIPERKIRSSSLPNKASPSLKSNLFKPHRSRSLRTPSERRHSTLKSHQENSGTGMTSWSPRSKTPNQVATYKKVPIKLSSSSQTVLTCLKPDHSSCVTPVRYTTIYKAKNTTRKSSPDSAREHTITHSIRPTEVKSQRYDCLRCHYKNGRPAWLIGNDDHDTKNKNPMTDDRGPNTTKWRLSENKSVNVDTFSLTPKCSIDNLTMEKSTPTPKSPPPTEKPDRRETLLKSNTNLAATSSQAAEITPVSIDVTESQVLLLNGKRYVF